MLIQKTNPVGADKALQKLQSHLHDKLITAWGLTGTPEKYKCYGRIYKNQLGAGMFLPEWYEGGDEYKEIYFDEVPAYSFFGISDKVEFDGFEHQTNAYLVFRVKLSEIKPLITHRADEEVHVDVLNIIKNGLYGFTYTSMETGVRNAFKEFTRWMDEKQYNDMHPWHVFRLNFKLSYNINNC
jgi:hypothetical protein